MAPREARIRLIYLRQTIRGCVLKLLSPRGRLRKTRWHSSYAPRVLQRPWLVGIPTPQPGYLPGGSREVASSPGRFGLMAPGQLQRAILLGTSPAFGVGSGCAAGICLEAGIARQWARAAGCVVWGVSSGVHMPLGVYIAIATCTQTHVQCTPLKSGSLTLTSTASNMHG